MCKTLVTYFSATGATMRLAEKIAATLHADVFAIKPLEKYTEEDLRWPSRNNRSYMEMKNKASRPQMAKKLKNIDEYDIIFLGFPIWYDAAPTIINTFIEENNLEGKDVYVFATSGAHRVDKSFNELKKQYPNIDFISAKRFSGYFYPREVFSWVNAS